MPLRQDVVALARSCSRKRLLFVGDSSVQELMWELMLRTSCIVGRGSCVPINPLNLPVGSCANPHCLELSQKWIESSHTLSGNRAYTLANSSAKANFRCFSMNACSPDGKAVFAAAHLPFDADFVWSGNAGILQNGGGLQNSFGSAGWLRYFANVTRSTMRHLRLPFDAVVFTSGLHDAYHNRYFTSSNATTRAEAVHRYADALAVALDSLVGLAPIRIFLSMTRRGGGRWAHTPLNDLGSRVHPATLQRVNAQVRNRFGSGWKIAVDAAPQTRVMSEHCAEHVYNGTHIGYSHTANCTSFAVCVGMLACAGGSLSACGPSIECAA